MPAISGSDWTAAPLRFFADRSLGSQIVPQALRSAGWLVETMDERYGAQQSQLIQDVQWIEEAALAGDVLLAKDLRVASNPLEATVIFRTSARVFALARRDVDGQAMARHFLDMEARIMRMARRAAGPYVVAVSQEGLRRVHLNQL